MFTTIFKDTLLTINHKHLKLYAGNLKVIAQYFQNSETMGGPTRDWLGIYEECAT